MRFKVGDNVTIRKDAFEIMKSIFGEALDTDRLNYVGRSYIIHDIGRISSDHQLYELSESGFSWAESCLVDIQREQMNEIEQIL